MGKNLKGKELGEGIRQRKDGRFTARFRSGNGKRMEKIFTELEDYELSNNMIEKLIEKYKSPDLVIEKVKNNCKG